MQAGVFELFSIGIGPSSSHVVGPMRASGLVAERLARAPVKSLTVTLYGSLALTCRGHGTDRAVLAGLRGHAPETIEPAQFEALRPELGLLLGEQRLPESAFVLELNPRGAPPGHPNAIRFTATNTDGATCLDTVFRSTGGGFITEDGVVPAVMSHRPPVRFANARQLVQEANALGSIAAVAARNETLILGAGEVTQRLDEILGAMNESIERGLRAEGELPGGLRVRRRASALHRSLQNGGGVLAELEWVALWAIAVNEENAAGGRIVTAPTNGAAGVIPAVIRYASTFEGASAEDAQRMLLTAACIGAVIKENASISGAEVGCQGEVGSAAAMAAAALAEFLGATPTQATNAAEIALEHHLGMTCDPVQGLVQIPCIERNAIGATKAIMAAKLALRGDGDHVVSLDQAIDAMRRTGLDMGANYRETSRGGLAVSVVEC